MNAAYHMRDSRGCCVCCKNNKSEGSNFQRLLHLKDTGIVIYKYKMSPTEPILDDIFILHNTTDRAVPQEVFVSEFEYRKVMCPRCKYLMNQTERILTSIKTLNKNEIRSVCEHCRKKINAQFSCNKCETASKLFLSTLGKLMAYPKTRSSLKSWIVDQHLIRHMTEEETHHRSEFQSEMFTIDTEQCSGFLRGSTDSVHSETDYYHTVKHQLDLLSKDNPELFKILEKKYPELFSMEAPLDFQTLQKRLQLIETEFPQVIKKIQQKHPKLFDSRSEYARTKRQLDILRQENPELFKRLQKEYPDIFNIRGATDLHALQQQLTLIKTEHAEVFDKIQQKHPQIFTSKSEYYRTKRKLDKLKEENPELFEKLYKQYPEFLNSKDIGDIKKQLSFIKSKYPKEFEKIQNKHPEIFEEKPKDTKKADDEKDAGGPEFDAAKEELNKIIKDNPELFLKLQKQFPDLLSGPPQNLQKLQQQLQFIKTKQDIIQQKSTEAKEMKLKGSQHDNKKELVELFVKKDKKNTKTDKLDEKSQVVQEKINFIKREDPKREMDGVEQTDEEKGEYEKQKEYATRTEKSLATEKKTDLEKDETMTKENIQASLTEKGKATSFDKGKGGSIAKGAEQEKSVVLEKEKTTGIEKVKDVTEKGKPVTEVEKRKVISVEMEKSNVTGKEEVKRSEKEKSGSEKGKSTSIEKERGGGTEKERVKGSESEKGVGTEKERTQGSKREKGIGTEIEQSKGSEREIGVGTEKGRAKGSEKEKGVSTKKERTKASETERTKDSEKKKGNVEKEKKRGAETENDTERRKSRVVEKGKKYIVEKETSKGTIKEKKEKNRVDTDEISGKLALPKSFEKGERVSELQKTKLQDQTKKQTKKSKEYFNTGKVKEKADAVIEKRKNDKYLKPAKNNDVKHELKISKSKIIELAKSKIEDNIFKSTTKENLRIERQKKALQKASTVKDNATIQIFDVPLSPSTISKNLDMTPGLFMDDSNIVIKEKYIVMNQPSGHNMDKIIRAVKTTDDQIQSYSFLDLKTGKCNHEQQREHIHSTNVMEQDSMNDILQKKALLFHTFYSVDSSLEIIEPEENIKDDQSPDHLENSGIVTYALSDRTFIEKGWTMLPTVKVLRRVNLYRMKPTHPEFNWFERNKNKGMLFYQTCEKLAEFDESGSGKCHWYYKNGKLALDYYPAEEENAGQRVVIYSNGERGKQGRSRPRTVLATCDYLGNGTVFDHAGKIRLKYNQSEGINLDETVGPVSKWKWNDFNEPPVLHQVMIDTHMPFKDPDILRLGNEHSEECFEKEVDEAILAQEFENFLKDQEKKVSSKRYKSFPICTKALKINEYFSLKILDQAHIYLKFRDGKDEIKVNLGMTLDPSEIIDTDSAEMGEISSTIERMPARTDSVAEMQKMVARAQHLAKYTQDRHEKINRPAAVASIDKFKAPMSRPLRRPLIPLTTNSSKSTCVGYSS